MRFHELWEAVRTQLDTARMRTLLAPGKIYIEGEDYSQPEGPAGTLWARLVIVPSTTLFDTPDTGPFRDVAFITRAEVGEFKAIDKNTHKPFSHQMLLDAIQEECETQLQNFVPSGLTRIKIGLPIYLFSSTQPNPLWDETRTLYWTSAQYRLEVAKV